MGAFSRQKRVRVFEDPKDYQHYRRYRRAMVLRGVLKVAGHILFWVAVVAAFWLILTVISGSSRPK
jgi:hypothetical protein